MKKVYNFPIDGMTVNFSDKPIELREVKSDGR